MSNLGKPSAPRKPGSLLRIYRALSPALCAATRLAGPLSAKLAQGNAGRQGLMDRLAAGAERVKGGVWFHVTSVGEYEQARPIITALQERSEPPLMDGWACGSADRLPAPGLDRRALEWSPGSHGAPPPGGGRQQPPP